MKTVFLAEGERHVLEALRLVLEQQTDFEIIGEARSAEGLLAYACKLSPDAILLDWDLPGFHPQRLISTLRECCPVAKIVALSVKPEHEKLTRQYGLDGFISKQLPPESFLASLNVIFEGTKNKKET
ncbi:MAG: response regulator transcription factor [Anaerolineales bacterium]|nr:response regulator transcription factor [Anaerolineales bacterium]